MTATEPADLIRYGCNCPHCGERINLTLSLGITNEPAPDPVESWLKRQSAEMRQTIQQVQSNGLLNAFEQVVRASKQDSMPRNLPKFFMGYLKTVSRMKLHAAQRLILHNEFKGKTVDVLQQFGVAALIIDGSLTMFFPADHLAMNTLGDGGKVRVCELGESQTRFTNWRRTRMGYVPAAASEFFLALNKRSIGEFARDSI